MFQQLMHSCVSPFPLYSGISKFLLQRRHFFPLHYVVSTLTEVHSTLQTESCPSWYITWLTDFTCFYMVFLPFSTAISSADPMFGFNSSVMTHRSHHVTAFHNIPSTTLIFPPTAFLTAHLDFSCRSISFSHCLRFCNAMNGSHPFFHSRFLNIFCFFS